MKNLFVFFAAILLALLTIAAMPLFVNAREKAGNIWYFGDGAGIDFNSGAPAALTDSVTLSSEGTASISDHEGNLLFYTDGNEVWDKTHRQMPNGSGLMGSPLTAQSAIIVPKPETRDIYYIFTVSESTGLHYSTVDMTLNGDLGDVTEKNLRLWSSAAGKITAVHHQNNTDIWVIVPGADDNTFHAYVVTASGVQTTPIISKAGIGHTKCEFDRSGYLKISPDGKKLALAIFDPGFFELFDFDSATGLVSNPIFLGEYAAAYGVEFSPDSTKLYGTVVSWVKKDIYQFDVEADDIPGSVKIIGKTSEDTRFRALQVATDGRIYVARENALHI